MGRRKIEIKAIKDDRNRSVTFLKRKGGLFKKAHELSVLCSVDVAVFIFGTNKKLYEYSSSDMRELITRYSYHGGPNEHKGPSDFQGAADEEEEDDENGTPPQHPDNLDPHMLPAHFQGQPGFPHIRHQAPSASPPMGNGVFGPRGRTPQSRPSSRNDIRRVGPAGPMSTPAPVAGYYMPQPGMYSGPPPQTMPPTMSSGLPPQVHAQYSYPPQQPHPHPHPHPHQHHQSHQHPHPHPQPHPQSHPQQHPPMQQYPVEEQRAASLAPAYPQGSRSMTPLRPSVSPPHPAHQPLPPQALQQGPHPSPPQPMISLTHSSPQTRPSAPAPVAPSASHQPPPQPQPQHTQAPTPPTLVEPKSEQAPVSERPRQPPLLDTSFKKQSQRKGGSIFTPIDENRSMLSQHLAAFHPEIKSESAVSSSTRSLSADIHSASSRPPNTSSPPTTANSHMLLKRTDSVSSAPDSATSLSRSDSFRPRLKVQIPEEPSDAGSATADTASPRGTTSTENTSQQSRRLAEPVSSGVVLPPPSPSASALLSAGATGPPNPFARHPPHQTGPNGDTPMSALMPSRYMGGEFLPSPSQFFPEWNLGRSGDSNTLPSPLNFATPIGAGPSFLREDPVPLKRKTPDMTGGAGHEGGNEPKRIKVDT